MMKIYCCSFSGTMMASILPGRSGRNANSNPTKIIVNLHGLVLDKKSNKLVKREPFICTQTQITAEALEYKVAKHLNIANFAVPLFGLCRLNQKHCDWLLPSTVLTSGDVLCYSMRLAVADQTRLSNIAKYSAATLEYIYWQVRDGFLQKQWDLPDLDPASSYPTILISDMQCHGYLRRLRASELKRALNYDEFSGPYFRDVKYMLDRGVTKKYCLENCSNGYKIKDGGNEQGEYILKEIRSCQYRYVWDVLKEVSQFGKEYKTEDGMSLVVISRAEEAETGQGLLLSAMVRHFKFVP